jgi:hypothetical protein
MNFFSDCLAGLQYRTYRNARAHLLIVLLSISRSLVQSPSRTIAATYSAVRGDMRAVLSRQEIFIIAEKVFAPVFGQPLALTEIMKPKIPDQDEARSFVVPFATKRQCQVKVRKSCRPSGMPTFSLDECKAAKPSTQFGLIIEFVSIFDLQFSPEPLWNFDGARLSRKITGLSSESAVELWQYPKEPIQIPHNYLWESFAPISAEWQHGPRHLSHSP